MKEWGEELVGEHGLSSVGAVVGATHPRAVGEARRLMPQAILLLPGVGAQGATPGDVARAFTSGPASALVTVSRSVMFAAKEGDENWRRAAGAEAAATRTRGLGRRRVVIDRQQVARFAAPAAFLLAVTILVLLVRSATSEDEPATAPPPATTPAPATTARRGEPAAGRDGAHHDRRRLDLHDRGRRHAADDRRPVRDDGGGAARAQPGRRPDGAADRADDPSPLRTTLGFAHVRRCLVALLCALVLAAPASAAAPEVDARAWLVQNGTTGEVLVQHRADQRVPDRVDHEADDGARRARAHRAGRRRRRRQARGRRRRVDDPPPGRASASPSTTSSRPRSSRARTTRRTRSRSTSAGASRRSPR